MAALPIAAASNDGVKGPAAAALVAGAPTRPALACPCRLGGAATAGQRCSPQGANHVGSRVGAIAAGILKEAAAATLGAGAPKGLALACPCRLTGAATAGKRCSPQGANHVSGRVGAIAARILKEAAAPFWVLGAH